LGQAFVTGQGIGQALGTFAASLALSAGFGAIGFHDIVNVGVRTAAFAAEGATIGVAGAAINGGDLFKGAYMGAGFGATMGFLSSEQFQNWRQGNEFISDKQFASNNAIRASRVENMADTLGMSSEQYDFRIGVSTGHAGAALIDPDGAITARGFWPKVGPGRIGASMGKTSPGVIRNEGGFWNGNGGGFDTGHSYKVNGTQAVMMKQYMTATPKGNWALTTNCTDWAVGAAASGGIYIPKNSYSSFGFADPSALRNTYNRK
jgi:hypothetical protein